MRIFKLKSFHRFCRAVGLSDEQLIVALDFMEAGGTSVGLGGDVFKLRIARSGGGKSGGFRTILAIRRPHRTLFVAGFAKSERDNLNNIELDAVKLIAKTGLDASDAEFDALVKAGFWKEIFFDGGNLQEQGAGSRS